MRIDRMRLNFPGMPGTIVDREELLKNFNLAECLGIRVEVDMDMNEFAAFRGWRARFAQGEDQ
jgi:hypothetical protein